MVQTSRSIGLSVVYSELLSFDGCEMYFHANPAWAGVRFEDLAYHFPDGVPLGIRAADGSLFVNPAGDRVLAGDDEILIVADDDSTIDFQASPVAAPISGLSIPGVRLEQRVENELFIGWNSKARIMVSEYADYVVEGSRIDVITDNATDEIREEISDLSSQLDTLELFLIEADPLDIDELSKLNPQSRDNIIILSEAKEDSDPDEVDSKTIMILLLLRRIAREKGGENPDAQLITEIMESSNQSLASSVGVKDFIVSDRFVSMILAQMSEDTSIKEVYDQIFEEDGSEIYLKPLRLYQEGFPAELSFADCMKLAQLRDEACLGIKIKAQESDHTNNYGVELIPEKTKRWSFQPDDCLVVLAEDET